MLSTKYLIKLILLVSLFILSESSLASVAIDKCGNYTFEIMISNEHDLYERQFLLFFKSKLQKKTFFYKPEKGSAIHASCIHGKKGENFLLFREFCSGNACPENIYGIFDPKKNKMLVNPQDWPKGNNIKIQQLLGIDPMIFITRDNSFCCYKQLYGE